MSANDDDFIGRAVTEEVTEENETSISVRLRELSSPELSERRDGLVFVPREGGEAARMGEYRMLPRPEDSAAAAVNAVEGSPSELEAQRDDGTRRTSPCELCNEEPPTTEAVGTSRTDAVGTSTAEAVGTSTTEAVGTSIRE